MKVLIIYLFNEKLGIAIYDSWIKIYNMRNKDIEMDFQGEDFVYQIQEGRLLTLYRDGNNIQN